MSQASGEKTEPPTPKRMRDARKKGQVARSQEVVTTISLFGVIAVIYGLGGLAWARLVVLMDQVAALAATGSEDRLHQGIAIAFDLSVAVMVPIVLATILLGIAANLIQFGVLFSLQAVAPKLEKISPIKGAKRIFSKKQLVELLKSVFKILFLSALLFLVIRDAIGPFVSGINCGVECLADVTDQMMVRVLLITALAFVIVAGLDFMIQRHFHTKSLMMTKQEVKREYKESEGDPMVKGQRRQLAQEFIMGDVRKQVKSSSAVVVNPTHLAVAIRYKAGETPLPMVVAKGRNYLAHDMRAEAERAGVPIFHNVRLARYLYAETEPNDYVPDDVFDVIAEILAWIGRHEGRLYRGTLDHGDIDMERGDHRESATGR